MYPHQQRVAVVRAAGDVVKLYVDGELVVNHLHNRRQSELRD